MRLKDMTASDMWHLMLNYSGFYTDPAFPPFPEEEEGEEGEEEEEVEEEDFEDFLLFNKKEGQDVKSCPKEEGKNE